MPSGCLPLVDSEETTVDECKKLHAAEQEKKRKIEQLNKGMALCARKTECMLREYAQIEQLQRKVQDVRYVDELKQRIEVCDAEIEETRAAHRRALMQQRQCDRVTNLC